MSKENQKKPNLDFEADINEESNTSNLRHLEIDDKGQIVAVHSDGNDYITTYAYDGDLTNQELLEMDYSQSDKKVKERIKTPEELEKEVKREANLKRAENLERGSLSKDGKMWFNLKTAQMFISKLSVLPANKKMLWRDANREVVELTADEASVYAVEIVDVLDIFYGLREAK